MQSLNNKCGIQVFKKVSSLVTRSQAPYRLKHESKMKTIEEQRVEARLLAYNILGVEGHARAWDGTRKNDKHLNTHINCTNETTSWLVHS